jgi:hypothetical protein
MWIPLPVRLLCFFAISIVGWSATKGFVRSGVRTSNGIVLATSEDHFHTQPKGASDRFFAANYLFDDRLYSQLSQLAKGSRIWGRRVDLRHENEVRSFCEDLKSKGLMLGVIDTSDVPNGAGASVVAQYVKLISQYAPESAIFLNTAPAGGGGVHWSYFAFSNGKIRGRHAGTIQRWYEIEMKKISSSSQMQSLLDDPDAIDH